MKPAFRPLLALLISCGETPAPPAPRAFDLHDRTRFLYLAVFEGLWEEGADQALMKRLSEKPEDLFVTKCPVCMPIVHALHVYATALPVPMYDGEGSGFPKELAEGLKSSDRAARLKAMESIVERYVTRRYQRLRLTDAQKQQMAALIEQGKKEGMGMKEPGFGDSCPSCAGASKFK